MELHTIAKFDAARRLSIYTDVSSWNMIVDACINILNSLDVSPSSVSSGNSHKESATKALPPTKSQTQPAFLKAPVTPSRLKHDNILRQGSASSAVARLKASHNADSLSASPLISRIPVKKIDTANEASHLEAPVKMRSVYGVTSSKLGQVDWIRRICMDAFTATYSQIKGLYPKLFLLNPSGSTSLGEQSHQPIAVWACTGISLSILDRRSAVRVYEPCPARGSPRADIQESAQSTVLHVEAPSSS